MNLVVGHHEGERRGDSRVCQKADEDGDHQAQGDGTLRISGFSPCRWVEVLGQENTGVKAKRRKKSPFLLHLPKQANHLQPLSQRAAETVPKPFMGLTITMLPFMTMPSKPTNE